MKLANQRKWIFYIISSKERASISVSASPKKVNKMAPKRIEEITPIQQAWKKCGTREPRSREIWALAGNSREEKRGKMSVILKCIIEFNVSRGKKSSGNLFESRGKKRMNKRGKISAYINI